MTKFLINTITKWDEPPRARHQIAQTLSKKYPVVFISANKTGWPGIKKKQINENLCVLIPYWPLPFKIRYRLPVINEMYQRWLFGRLIDKFKAHTVINFDFSARLIYKYFKKVIYYCNDNFSSISKKINPEFIYNYHKNCEKFVSENARFCIATTNVIKNNINNYNPNTFKIQLGGPNINDYNLDINYNPRKSNKINVGLVGYISSFNLSYKLLNSLISYPGINLILIGPIEKKIMKGLANNDKITALGILTGKNLLEQVNKFDIAIAPYNKNRLNEGGFPNKLWVYLSLGKPVVVSDLVALKNIKFPEKSIYIPESEGNFHKLILKANNDNTAELIKERIDFAKSNSWDNRIEEFIKIYHKFFN